MTDIPTKHELISCLAVGGRWITKQRDLQVNLRLWFSAVFPSISLLTQFSSFSWILLTRKCCTWKELVCHFYLKMFGLCQKVGCSVCSFFCSAFYIFVIWHFFSVYRAARSIFTYPLYLSQHLRRPSDHWFTCKYDFCSLFCSGEFRDRQNKLPQPIIAFSWADYYLKVFFGNR